MAGTIAVPGSGTAPVLAAQVLLRRTVIVRETGWGQFGPPLANTAARELRDELTVPVNGLARIWYSVFQAPQYNRGDVVFNARNTLVWRPVFQMPPDNTTDITGVNTQDWLPITSPILMVPAVPITMGFVNAGFHQCSIEIIAGAAGVNQGEDRVYISISASM